MNQKDQGADNISAGTQVVVREIIRGQNDSLVHPKGAVGVITRTPVGTEILYQVRFPEGGEASLKPEQFEVLKHFKKRLGALSTDDVAPPFDLENGVIYRCIVGSRAYGLETELSDTDYRGIYIAPPEIQWSLYGAPEQFEDNQTQSCYWELQKFILMALKANPNILECLYSPLVEKMTPLGEQLLAIRSCFLSQMIFQTFNGYAMSQFKKMEQDRRNQGGIRWKHAVHLLRLLLAGTRTLREGELPVQVGKNRGRLLQVKRGELPWSEIDHWRKELHQDFEKALETTRLPERPDYERANRFLLQARRQMIL